MGCELSERCASFVESCNSTVCKLLKRIKMERTVDETVSELGLGEGDVQEVLKRMHRNREYVGSGNYARDYTRIFRQEALLYMEEC